jgi:hypothetical protein
MAKRKGRKSNLQFDSRPLKVKNCPDFLVCRWRATYRWKAINEVYNFVSNFISIKGLHTKLWDPKVGTPQSCGSPNFGNFETPIWESQEKMPIGCGPHGEAQSIILGGKLVASPKFGSW